MEDSPPMNQTFLKKASEAPREAVHALSSSGQPTSRSAPSLCRSSKRSTRTRSGCCSIGHWEPGPWRCGSSSVTVRRGPRSDEALRVARGSPRRKSKAPTSSVTSTSTTSRTPIGALDTSHGLGGLEFIGSCSCLGEGFVSSTPVTAREVRGCIPRVHESCRRRLPQFRRECTQIPSRFSFSIADSTDYTHLISPRRRLPRPPRGAGADRRPDRGSAGKISLAGRNVLTLKKHARRTSSHHAHQPLATRAKPLRLQGLPDLLQQHAPQRVRRSAGD